MEEQNERILKYPHSEDMTDYDSDDDLGSTLNNSVEVAYDDTTCDSLINSLKRVSVQKANFKSENMSQITEKLLAGPNDNSTPASMSPAMPDQSTSTDSSNYSYRRNNNYNNNRLNRRPFIKTYSGYRQRFHNHRPNLPYFRRKIAPGLKRPVHERLGYPYNNNINNNINNQEEFFNNLRKGFNIFVDILKLLCQGDERLQ
ncbi:hypothetical protein TKK_0017757 [Trichogramma kaykai]